MPTGPEPLFFWVLSGGGSGSERERGLGKPAQHCGWGLGQGTRSKVQGPEDTTTPTWLLPIGGGLFDWWQQGRSHSGDGRHGTVNQKQDTAEERAPPGEDRGVSEIMEPISKRYMIDDAEGVSFQPYTAGKTQSVDDELCTCPSDKVTKAKCGALVCCRGFSAGHTCRRSSIVCDHTVTIMTGRSIDLLMI